MYIEVVCVISELYIVNFTWYIHMCLSRCILLFIDLCRLCYTWFSTCVDCVTHDCQLVSIMLHMIVDLCRLCHTCLSTCVDCVHTFYIDGCVNCISHFRSTCCWCRMLHKVPLMSIGAENEVSMQSSARFHEMKRHASKEGTKFSKGHCWF